jgi:hypothetical protein
MIKGVEPARQKKSMVLKVLAGVLALFAVLAALSLFAIYRWYSRPETQEQLGAAKDFMRLMMSAAKAPGAEQLRKMGCDQAAVFTKEEAAAFMESLGKFAPPEERGTMDVPMIFCNVRVKKELSCKDLTLTYASSVTEAPNEVLVLMQTQSFPQQVVCSGLYLKDGTLIEALQ